MYSIYWKTHSSLLLFSEILPSRLCLWWHKQHVGKQGAHYPQNIHLHVPTAGTCTPTSAPWNLTVLIPLTLTLIWCLLSFCSMLTKFPRKFKISFTYSSTKKIIFWLKYLLISFLSALIFSLFVHWSCLSVLNINYLSIIDPRHCSSNFSF